ncbi:enoyl-CoA hydratase [Frankia sp. R43]|uniref:enoyl-CoA hydratase n=1 Tax=Frankia sp. R43 TaxID=269536 RepID=UPI0006CA3166|nr:enoyl-CoA hydratase [Frankia sp. R43]KPM51940.1 enoyl-CoA hydratase [Frankia sp. R43]
MDLDMLTTVTYETIDGNIARITLDRPEVRNAQNRQLIYELNEALTAAAFDDEIKVLILAANGPHFSSGHDQRDTKDYDGPPVGIAGGFAKPGAEGLMAREEEAFLNMCRRWQQLPKPTIAQVQGKTIAGGLMLAWVCDLIVASKDASFVDITVAMGVNGVEWFAHPWELGIRKAKEMLFTGEPVSAVDAHRLGMVNRVVPREELANATLQLGRTIATKPSFGLKLAKLSCNQTLDAQGFWTAQQAAFSLQHLGHSHNQLLFGSTGDPSGMKIKPASSG